MSIDKDILDRLMDGALITPVTEAAATMYVGICVGTSQFQLSHKSMIIINFMYFFSPILLMHG